MHEIRIHGRGGQGVVTAAELIAMAAFAEGWQAQAFPSFGVERTGAPIEAFVRLDKKPIRTREHVYRPDILIIQDATLIGTVNVTSGCSGKTMVIINTAKLRNEIALFLDQERRQPVLPENIHALNATQIALDVLGKNIVNTVIVGAFAKATKLISMDSIIKAVTEKFAEKGPELTEKNIKAVEKAYELN
ncbi:MAG: 2-oxoacid:acceptor oxidoreductase family protein [Planctomycetes bacterium]|nr:2-oxoacid:acceptor oxidoreductase family protein [Planctomycetota bacterium]